MAPRGTGPTTISKGTVRGSIESPKKNHVGVLIPKTSECNLIYKQCLYRGDDVKKLK